MDLDADGWVKGARQLCSPNYDPRPTGMEVVLVVVHNISLPPGQYGGPGVEQLFSNTLCPDEHPYYADIAHLRVSAHFFIRRDGELLQFVATSQRAWHAGVSVWCGRERCNDFSIGIEVEGSDHECFQPEQYETLCTLLQLLCRHYPVQAVAGHSDIAPGRKTDPGPYFDWEHLTVCGLPHRY